MKYKIVIIKNQSTTEMFVSGTVYFSNVQQAQEYIAQHNSTSASRAYLVHSLPEYTVTDNP